MGARILDQEEHAMTPIPPQASNKEVYKYMPAKHVVAFLRAAGFFKVWILVRRGNAESLQWVGKDGYVPKPLDCKAKTADRPDTGCSGLVASPELKADAFLPLKLKKAKEEWAKFADKLYTFDPGNPRKNLEADRAGKHYTLQLDKSNRHYGCVLFKPVFRAQAEYLHADYDLYAIVPSADPTLNKFVQETGFGDAPHSRSQNLYDVQYFFKAAGIREGEDFCSPMIRHGEQETFKTDWNDTLDVFWPDGKTITALDGSIAIQDFYRTTLKGRQQVGDNAVIVPWGDKWKRTFPRAGA